MLEERIDLGSFDEKFFAIVGRADENLKFFADLFGIRVIARGTEVIVKGDPQKVKKFTSFLRKMLKEVPQRHLNASQVREEAKKYLSELDQALTPSGDSDKTQDGEEVILITHRKKAIVPKTPSQKAYIKAIKENDIVFGIGPAGTGKTYLAMAMALKYLKENRISKIILTRPAVEAGEKLGFLPGGIAEKVHPYLTPLYDALYDMVDFDKASYLLEKGVIEIAPLAFMRGRTLNDAFIILDEAQNTTREQMKMFLTRIGFGSKAVITGDVTQIDLPRKTQSGLVEALKILKGIEGIGFVEFKKEDVVRHPIVQKIIQAYEEFEEGKNATQMEETESPR
ncbi:MAG: PhoH family protein [Gammaproteobacteria bacterium]|nr:MAG: PhoH family protein [Gammaproteobacteria bacterium]